ncbi:MAG: excinuclease ABC subunit UvrC [Clostridia bacterium]|nr:excinuclease ABC subunit UvrC [Clostridia bacterium]
MFNIEEELKKLPDKPGVYIMRDKNDNIIYVGKAVVLKNRVRQYFRKSNKTIRIQKMVSLIDHFEYIVTDNEAEALILECNLIKKNMPKFNVLLKDDKTYPYIKIDVKSDYPNVFITRRILNDGAKYFGPYANAGSAKEMINFIKERFQIRQCKNFKNKDRACLNYHIKKCLAPCMGYISKEEYRKQIDQIIMLLEGKTKEIIEELSNEIVDASNNLEFEKAAILRDKKIAIERVSEKQKVSNINEKAIDVIGTYKNELEFCIEIFFVRNSKMIGREHYFFENTDELTAYELLSEFIKQFYINKIDLPSKIMIPEEIEDLKVLQDLLSQKAQRKIEFKVPQKGEKLKFIEMANNNAKITLENRNKEKEDILLELKERLNLKNLPKKIECFDISNLAGEYIVAGMCVAKDGKINKKLARRFKIKTVFTQDDPRCMEEVVTRRLKHSLENPKGAFGKLPDIIFADGGITQMRAIRRAIDKYNLQIPVFGMVKDDKHRTNKLIDENKTTIKTNQNIMNFITAMQDEVHRIAIEYNRKLRNNDTTKSKLDEIKGIGTKRKQELLKKFGSVEGIKKADISEITKVNGITDELARKIKKELV